MVAKRNLRDDISNMVEGIEFEPREQLPGKGFILKPDRDFTKQELNALYLTLYNQNDREDWPYHRYEELNAKEMRDIIRGLVIVADEETWPEGTDELREEKIGDNGRPFDKTWLRRIRDVLRKTG